jgi:hypothetical protein
MAFSPPTGYWCGLGTAGGGGIEYTGVTTGLVMIGDDGVSHVLPRFPYPNSTGAVIHMFRPQAWASWMFEVGSANDTTLFFSKGGFQGARGCGNRQGDAEGCGSEFYIENVYQELDVEVRAATIAANALGGDVMFVLFVTGLAALRTNGSFTTPRGRCTFMPATAATRRGGSILHSSRPLISSS